MTEEIIIDCIHKHYDSEICNAYSNNVFSWDCSEFNNCYYKQLKRLEQENKELKELNKKICEDWEKEIKFYWDAFEEIREMFSNQVAWVGQLTNFEEEIYNKINEVL